MAKGEDNYLITCIVQRGRADKVNEAAIAAGAQGATVFFARGTGVRQNLGIMGKLISPEKDVIMIVVPEAKVKTVFSAVVEAGELRKPGKGFAYVTRVLAARLGTLVEDEALRARMGAAARHWINDNASARALAPLLTRVYERLLDEGDSA